MMCAVCELGLDITNYPGQIEHGIMILDKELEKRLGENIVDVLELREDIIDFEITPNRPDCLSIEGLGRETAISLNEKFKNPHKHLLEEKVEKKDELEGLKVEIKDTDLCYRYVARVVKNVKIGPSPKWLTRRLNACGVRSINNIVDITNYVMLEMGQPMHAFDINSIEGKQIIVRRAKNEEKITTLDKEERNLDNDMLVIADKNKPVAIAGVMGGLNSEIENGTDTIVFESAVFYGGSVRRTAKKIGLRTEASSRYEKGLSPENALKVINRAMELVKQLEVGDVVDGCIDIYPEKQKEHRIPLNPEKINNLIGVKVTKEEMLQILEKLEMKIVDNVVIPPYFRMDIEQEADIAEEILRFYGYDKLESTLTKTNTTLGIKTKKQDIEDRLKYLLLNSGLSEIYTYGFINEKDLEKSCIPYSEEIIKIKNPLSEDYTIMRPSTIPSMLTILANNFAKKNKNVGLFDISRTYKNINGSIQKGEIAEENTILTIGMYGEKVDFYILKGIIENILEISGVSRYQIKSEEENQSYHPGRTANIFVGTDSIATFGQIHPKVVENYDMTGEKYLAEINISKVVKYSKNNKKYIPIPKFPAVERDISIVVDRDIEVGRIEEVIQKQAKKLLEKIELFDVYYDEKLGENKKSVAYALTFRDSNKTLTDDDISPIMEKIIKELEKSFEAELRR